MTLLGFKEDDEDSVEEGELDIADYKNIAVSSQCTQERAKNIDRIYKTHKSSDSKNKKRLASLLHFPSEGAPKSERKGAGEEDARRRPSEQDQEALRRKEILKQRLLALGGLEDAKPPLASGSIRVPENPADPSCEPRSGVQSFAWAPFEEDRRGATGQPAASRENGLGFSSRSVYGQDAEAAVQVKSGSRVISLSDVQQLVLWSLAGENVVGSPTWVFLQRKPLVSGVVLVLASGLSEKTFQKYKTHLPFLASCGDPARVRAPTGFAKAADSAAALLEVQLKLGTAATGRRNASAAKAAVKLAKTAPKLALPQPSFYRMPAALMQERDFPLARSDDEGRLFVPEGYVSTVPCGRPEELERMVALDCEMCITEKGFELTRATLMDCNRKVLLDTLVLPARPVLDFNTRFSGITPEMLRGVRTSLEDVQELVLRHVHSETLLVGHGLENDLRALQLCHARILDTSHLFPHPRGPPARTALRVLAQKHLRRQIQNGSHCSEADALAALDLVALKLKHGPTYGIPAPTAEGAQKLLDVLSVHAKTRGCLVDRRGVISRHVGRDSDAVPVLTDREAAAVATQRARSGIASSAATTTTSTTTRQQGAASSSSSSSAAPEESDPIRSTASEAASESPRVCRFVWTQFSELWLYYTRRARSRAPALFHCLGLSAAAAPLTFTATLDGSASTVGVAGCKEDAEDGGDGDDEAAANCPSKRRRIDNGAAAADEGETEGCTTGSTRTHQVAECPGFADGKENGKKAANSFGGTAGGDTAAMATAGQRERTVVAIFDQDDEAAIDCGAPLSSSTSPPLSSAMASSRHGGDSHGEPAAAAPGSSSDPSPPSASSEGSAKDANGVDSYGGAAVPEDFSEARHIALLRALDEGLRALFAGLPPGVLIAVASGQGDTPACEALMEAKCKSQASAVASAGQKKDEASRVWSQADEAAFQDKVAEERIGLCFCRVRSAKDTL